MEATVRAVCPNCKTALRVPAQWVGQAVKCKKCGAQVRVKAKPESAPSPDDTAPATPLPPAAAAPVPAPAPYPQYPGYYPAPVPAPQPPPNAFDFSQPAAASDDDFFGLKDHPEPAVDANGYPLPPGYAPPPGYPYPPGYGPPPGYPYAPPPGYPYPPGYGPPPGYPAPGAPYPYPLPPGYPQPGQPGYAPPAGYAPPGYAPPPGYGYPQPPAPDAPQPVQPEAAQPAPALPAPFPPAKPGLAPAKPGGNPKEVAPPPSARKAAKPAPVPPSNEFRMDPAGSAATAAYSSRSRYRRGDSKSKYIWLGLCALLTLALIGGGIYGGKILNEKFGDNKKKEEPEVKNEPAPVGPAKPVNNAFPRRLLFVSITKYMYLNPLTSAQQGAPDRTKPAALRLAFDWRIPTDKENNQVFVLSDTVVGGPDERLPMKNVVQGAYQDFFKTSRGQDRVVVYFGGHALFKDGKAYIAPMEAELESEEWEQSLIPLAHFYDELKKCKATQKVVIWDVCRFNPEKGRVRPGSEPMSEELYKALSEPPAGVQAVVTCKPGENALEFSALRPEGYSGAVYSGSSFLESMKFVAEPRNNRMPRAAAPTPADPIPIDAWAQAIAKRTVEMSELADKSGSGGKQTVATAGTAPASLAAVDSQEKVAARFEFPQPPKGAAQVDIAAVAREFLVPPLKPGLSELALADFPFPATIMKDYAADVSIDEIMKDKEKYRFRVAVLDALAKVREKWGTGAGTTQIRQNVEGPIDEKKKAEVKKEQEFWALGAIELELHLDTLKAVANLRESEPKRWQANYDFALAAVKARLAYMNEYNKLLGNLVTETLPNLDPKLGQDGYTLVASETLKSGKDVKKLAEEAQELFQEITVKYKGTPWAIQAKQEKSVAIGLNWKPASLKAAPPAP